MVSPHRLRASVWISSVILALISFGSRQGAPYSSRTSLVISAGKNGWKLLEYKELAQSAREYLGKEAVHEFVLEESESLVAGIQKSISLFKPTHYYFDPRTGWNPRASSTIYWLRIAIMLEKADIVPICVITDLPQKHWLKAVSILSARRGVVVSLSSNKKYHRLLPHGRFIGPIPMALSQKTVKKLERKTPKVFQGVKAPVTFVGSTYDNRADILNEIFAGLEANDIPILRVERTLGGHRISNSEYLRLLSNASVVVTTTRQADVDEESEQPHFHLVYRIMEAAAAGAIVCAEKTPSMNRFFEPGKDFIEFENAKEAVVKIVNLLQRERKLAEAIAESGYRKARALVDSRSFWTIIDSALGRFALK